MTPNCEAVRPTTEEAPVALSPEHIVEKRSLADVVLEVRLDARIRPERYLGEIIVPFGGE